MIIYTNPHIAPFHFVLCTTTPLSFIIMMTGNIAVLSVYFQFQDPDQMDLLKAS